MSNKTKTQKPRSDLSFSKVGWLLILAWLAFVIIASQTSFTNQLFGSLDGGATNWAFGLILLVPVAMLALPLFYQLDFSLYTPENKPPKLSKISRALISIILTCFLLLISWYVTFLVSFSI